MTDAAETSVVEEATPCTPADTPCVIRPDLKFKEELAEFGGHTFNQCYQCATCSAVCEISPDENPFPRKEMIWTMWGLKDRLVRNPDIWQCYYCGDCSERCPRGADPGELMMALRRYAISAYDWTGLSRKLYTSRVWEIGAVLFVSLIVVLLFVISGAFSADRMVADHVSVETFIPHMWVHWADWVMAGVLTFFLLSNSARLVMFLLDGQKVPPKLFLTELPTFFTHMATQKKWRECGAHSRVRWLKHFILVTGYVTMFTLVMVFLKFLQEDTSKFTWVSIAGYYATCAICFYSGDALLGRLRKKEELHKHSHDSDWMFLILLFLGGLTGIMMHLFRLLDLAYPTYFIYVIHLAIVVPMLVVEVPFGKWAHLMYRPLALYIKVIRDKARALEAEAAPVAAAT